MRYMLLIYLEETAIDDGEREACYQESIALTKDLDKKGQFLAASPLQPVATAATVRIRDGRTLITDGPFAETREQLGGYFLVDAKDAEEAIAIAKRIPAARFGTVEVRPLVELAGVPEKNLSEAVDSAAAGSTHSRRGN